MSARHESNRGGMIFGSAGVSPAAFGLWPEAFSSERIRRDADWSDRDGRAPQSPAKFQ
jgi:hypothetical protein